MVCLTAGCGAEPTAEPTVTPREVKADVARLSLVRFSADGKWLAAGGTNGEVVFWQDTHAAATKLASDRSAPLISLSWSPDGLLAVSDAERGFFGWQFGQSEPKRRNFPRVPSPVVCLAFRPNAAASELVLGMRDGSLIIIEKRGTQQLKPDHRGPVKQAVFSPDGKWLITAGADGQLLWRDGATHKLIESVNAHDAEISRVVISPQGTQLVSGDWNGQLKVWDIVTHKRQREFEQPEAVSGLGWIRAELISAGWDGSLRGWDIATGRCRRTIAAGRPIHDLACHPKSSQVATVSLDGSVRLWDWPQP